jgi:hypothetical protein
MPTSSLEELRGRISAGAYTVDSGVVAGEILAKFALVRRVTSLMMSDGESAAAPPARRSRSAQERQSQPRRERLS